MLMYEDSFINLGLNSYLIEILKKIGYKKPLPIQVQCIPLLLKGYDVLGMAHTGSGKTVAFLLPLLQNIDVKCNFSQGLIITPTRELAIQIGQVCADFTRYIEKINITVLYGGQNYIVQFRSLKKKPHLIVGTPGRLLDHLNRGTVDISKLKMLVIDEADEMLRMGFIQDMEEIIKKSPLDRQTALFSATLPINFRQISARFMSNPKEVYINSYIDSICSDIKQSYWLVKDIKKCDALVRFLEIEDFDAAIVFVRTRCATLMVSKILEDFGFNSAALNGDMNQVDRNRTVSSLRDGKLNVLITTDVAARGLDIHRISLVINYDVPNNYDSYVHRAGRTGRAGNIGKSLLFIERQEYHVLRRIKSRVGSNISEIQYPTSSSIISCRLLRLTNIITNHLYNKDIEKYKFLLSRIKIDKNFNIEYLAAALLKIAQGNRALILPPDPIPKKINKKNISKKIHKNAFIYTKSSQYKVYNTNNIIINLYRISIGNNDGVKRWNIYKAISNKINRYSCKIKNIQLFSSYSCVKIVIKKITKPEIIPKLFYVSILNKLVKIKFLGCVSDIDGTSPE